MESKRRTKHRRRAYAARRTSAELVIGQMVNRSLDRFLLRGEKGAKDERSLYSTPHHLLRLFRNGWNPSAARLVVG